MTRLYLHSDFFFRVGFSLRLMKCFLSALRGFFGQFVSPRFFLPCGCLFFALLSVYHLAVTSSFCPFTPRKISFRPIHRSCLPEDRLFCLEMLYKGFGLSTDYGSAFPGKAGLRRGRPPPSPSKPFFLP